MIEETKLSEGYDWRVSLKKAFSAALMAGFVTLAVGLGAWLDNPKNVEVIVGQIPDSLGVATKLIAPTIIVGVGRFLANWAKNREK